MKTTTDPDDVCEHCGAPVLKVWKRGVVVEERIDHDDDCDWEMYVFDAGWDNG